MVEVYEQAAVAKSSCTELGSAEVKPSNVQNW